MLRGHHVLVVEDEPLIALDLEQALSSAGAQVGISGTVENALEAAAAPTVTAAIIDLRLNGHSVREVIERLAARALPFIFYTGQTETPDVADGSRASNKRILASTRRTILWRPVANETCVDFGPGLIKCIEDHRQYFRRVRGAFQQVPRFS